MKKLLLLTIVLSVFVFACGKGKTEGGVKNSLVWAQGTDVFSFDPHIGKETTAIQVTGNIYDTLLTVDSNMTLKPMLAKEWKQIDGTTYEFVIRDDVTFHTGDKLTAEDIKYSLDRALDSVAVAYIVDFIESVEIIEPYKIRLTTKAPYAPTYMNLTHPAAGIVSKKYTSTNENILKTKPMGSGPFKFVEWKQGDYVKMVANEDYWGGAPNIKNLTMRIIPENAQRTIALELGEVDVSYDILPNDIKKIQENKDLVLIEAPALTAFIVVMNLKKPYLENKLVREAIILAIDSNPMIESIYYGSAQAADTMIPPNSFGFQKDIPVLKRDLEKAKKLLAEAGYPNGFKTSITVNDNQTRVEMCQVIQAQLKEIGIDCAVNVLEFATYVDNMNKGNHELGLSGWTTSTGDADYTYFAQFHTSKIGSQGNRTMKTIPGIDIVLEKGRSSSDAKERMMLYKEVEKIATENAVNRPLIFTILNVGTTKKVKNFEMIPNGYYKYHQVIVEK